MKKFKIYRVKMTHSGQEPEYGNDFNYEETVGIFTSYNDARRVMFAKLKSCTQTYFQNEVKIGDDYVSLAVRGCGYAGTDEFYSFRIINEVLIDALVEEIYLPAIECNY